MAQKQRIHDFIKGRLAQMEVAGRQTALVFGQGSKSSEIENYQNEYKCHNAATECCSSNLHKCVNEKSHCQRATNTLECTNKLAE